MLNYTTDVMILLCLLKERDVSYFLWNLEPLSKRILLDNRNPGDVMLFHHFCQLSAFPDLLTLLKLDKSGIMLPLDFQRFILISTLSAAVRLEWILASSIDAKFNNII